MQVVLQEGEQGVESQALHHSYNWSAWIREPCSGSCLIREPHAQRREQNDGMALASGKLLPMGAGRCSAGNVYPFSPHFALRAAIWRENPWELRCSAAFTSVFCGLHISRWDIFSTGREFLLSFCYVWVTVVYFQSSSFFSQRWKGHVV